MTGISGDRNMMRMALFLMLLTQIPEPIPAPKEVPSIAGFYQVSGITPMKRGYTGVCYITEDGPNYSVVWVLETRQICRGTGVLKDSTFVVGFESNGGVGVFYFTVKKVQGRYHLHGIWASGDDRGEEELTWLKPRSL